MWEDLARLGYASPSTGIGQRHFFPSYATDDTPLGIL